MLGDVRDHASDGERSFAGRHPESPADDRRVREEPRRDALVDDGAVALEERVGQGAAAREEWTRPSPRSFAVRRRRARRVGACRWARPHACRDVPRAIICAVRPGQAESPDGPSVNERALHPDYPSGLQVCTQRLFCDEQWRPMATSPMRRVHEDDRRYERGFVTPSPRMNTAMTDCVPTRTHARPTDSRRDSSPGSKRRPQGGAALHPGGQRRRPAMGPVSPGDETKGRGRRLE